MGLLSRLGLGQKKARPVGQRLERGRDVEPRLRRRNLIIKTLIFLVLVVLTLAAFPRGERFQYGADVGDPWRKETLTAPFDFPIYKSQETIDAERREVRFSTPPYFVENPNARAEMEANRDTVAHQLDRTLDAYASAQFNRLRGRPVEATEDSLRYVDLRRGSWLKATQEQWQRLIESYNARIPGLASATREPAEGPPLDERLLEEAWEMGMQLLNVGVLDVPLDTVLTDQIIIWNEADHSERARSVGNLYGLNEAYIYVQNQFRERYPDDQALANLGSAFFRALFQPSLVYQRAETLREWQRKERRISPTRDKVMQGEVIVRQGEEVTPEILRKLISLERVRTEQGGISVLWKVALGQFLMTLATYVIFFLYLYLLRRTIFNDNKQILLVALLFAGIIGLYAIALRLPDPMLYAVPVAIAPILLTVIFDSRVGLFGVLTLSLIGGLLLNYDFEFTFATIYAAALGVFSVRDIKNRGQFFLSAGLVFTGYVVVLGATSLLHETSQDRLLTDLLLVAVNSFLLLMAYPLLWVFERSFDMTTDLSLLELSDTNRPLLKELSLRAPGTFNHSLQVANLAEAAADSIGANALLTRVGALYHDIGKMLKPEYFVENQRPGDNPHEQLKPRMSALIIASHVKEGLEMGRQYLLPQRVLDFIPMHHGTTRIEYFYRKAIEQRQESDSQVLEGDFRYPGPRPYSKETAILMLSDSVEAASRSLTDPTHKRLETLIEMIFKARIEDGQLDDTDLTFKDLSLIKETFLAMLLGIYHVRVKYPGQDKIEGKKGEAKAPDAAAPASEAPPGEAENRTREDVVGVPEQSIADRRQGADGDEEDLRFDPGRRKAGPQASGAENGADASEETSPDENPSPEAGRDG